MEFPKYAIRTLVNGSAGDAEYDEVQAWIDSGDMDQAASATERAAALDVKVRELLSLLANFPEVSADRAIKCEASAVDVARLRDWMQQHAAIIGEVTF